MAVLEEQLLWGSRGEGAGFFINQYIYVNKTETDINNSRYGFMFGDFSPWIVKSSTIHAFYIKK